MLDAIMSCERCCETVAVRFPETDSGQKLLEKMLLISVLELLITLVDCVKIYDMKEIRRIH